MKTTGDRTQRRRKTPDQRIGTMRSTTSVLLPTVERMVPKRLFAPIVPTAALAIASNFVKSPGCVG